MRASYEEPNSDWKGGSNDETAKRVGGNEPSVYRKILVGYDGSATSEKALIKAANLAKMLSAKLKIVVGFELPRSTSTPELLVPARLRTELDQEQARHREEALAKSRRAVEEAGKLMPLPNISSGVADVVEGNPSQLILSRSETFGADLIVVGSRGLSALDKFILGSVSTAVVNKSTVDVLVVK